MKKVYGILSAGLLFCNILSAQTTGETLQSVTDRGFETNHPIFLHGTLNGLRSQFGGGGSFWLNTPTGDMMSIGGVGGDAPSSGAINILYNGNVGIGTTSPAYKLHIAGQTVASKAFVSQGMNDSWAGGGTYIGYNTGDGAGRVGAFDYTSYSWKNLILNEGGGNIGIGTTSPSYKLDVNGDAIARGGLISSVSDANIGGHIDISNPAKTAAGAASTWRIYNMAGGYGNSLQFWAYDAIGCGTGLCHNRFTLMDNGNIGIGTSDPQAKMQIGASFNSMPSSTALGIIGNNSLRFLNDDGNADYGSYLKNNGLSSLTIGTRYAGTDVNVLTLNNGNVGIGTTTPGSYKLAVEGTVGARKIKVTQASWADYVFDSSYQLASLSQVEKYIQENRHLPEIPSAATIAKDGIDLGDNQALLLKKIEELTLYIIEQDKRIKQLEESRK